MKLISVCMLSLFLFGCAGTPRIVYKTEYQEVKVPVVYKLERGKRPVYTSKDTPSSYLLKIIQYAKTLEIIIDNHNK